MAPLEQLLQPGDLTHSGVYWYFDLIGGDAQIVEVGEEGVRRTDGEIRFRPHRR